jgi:hypothetical protein
MEINRTKINNKITSMFEKLGIIDILSNNFVIGGGFPRFLNYLIKQNENNDFYLNKLFNFLKYSDIDFYCDSEKTFEDYMNKIWIDDENKFLSPFCVNFRSHYDFINDQNIGINKNNIFYDYSKVATLNFQFVNKFYFRSIEKLFESFDFENCKYCIALDHDGLYLYKTKDADFYNEKRTLKINHNNSPLLGHRIIKYLSSKDLDEVSECSREVIKNWLFKLKSEEFGDSFKPAFDSCKNLSYLTKLDKLVNFSKEELILFIGKVNVSYSYAQGYGVMVREEIDWALEKLK